LTTVAESLVTLLDANYGAGGGDKPANFIQLLDYRTSPPIYETNEGVIIWLPVRTRYHPVNENYTDIEYEVFVHVTTPESDDRCLEISTEVRRIVTTTMITGMTHQRIDAEADVGDRQRKVYATELRVVLVKSMEENA